ncbi:MAG: glucokinase [Cyanobacteriota bacterium]|nr:glucokinase [Cyanobacteriota bacterium]
MLLAGDIGGTQTRLRLIAVEAGQPGETCYEEDYPSSQFPDLAPIVRQFLDAAQTALGKQVSPEKACFAIAGPVTNDTSILTNLSWNLDARRLERELNIPKIALINDFAAIGYGILGLDQTDLHLLQDIPPQSDAPIAVIGAGTGLGQGFLIPKPSGGYRVFATEGGHASFAARNELEFGLLQDLRDRHNLSNVSVERIVSGQGIASIYQFLRDRGEMPESPELRDRIQQWERGDSSIDAAAIIGENALEGRDRLCQQTLKLFVAAYGAEAGNQALKLLPYGGVYIAGGIAAKILPLLEAGEFMEAFLDKGRMRSVLKNIPVRIILNTRVGAIGAAIRAAEL